MAIFFTHVWVSRYETVIPRVDGLSTDPRDLRRHTCNKVTIKVEKGQLN